MSSTTVPTNVYELLAWLTSSGGALLLIMWATSWGLEGWAKWDQLPSKSKSLIILGISVLGGILSTFLTSLPASVLDAVDPYVRTVLVIVGMWLATQVAHRLDGLRVKPPTPTTPVK